MWRKIFTGEKSRGYLFTHFAIGAIELKAVWWSEWDGYSVNPVLVEERKSKFLYYMVVFEQENLSVKDDKPDSADFVVPSGRKSGSLTIKMERFQKRWFCGKDLFCWYASGIRDVSSDYECPRGCAWWFRLYSIRSPFLGASQLDVWEKSDRRRNSQAELDRYVRYGDLDRDIFSLTDSTTATENVTGFRRCIEWMSRLMKRKKHRYKGLEKSRKRESRSRWYLFLWHFFCLLLPCLALLSLDKAVVVVLSVSRQGLLYSLIHSILPYSRH